MVNVHAYKPEPSQLLHMVLGERKGQPPPVPCGPEYREPHLQLDKITGNALGKDGTSNMHLRWQDALLQPLEARYKMKC